tara:strand:- start:170 stop:451 length:282 start_codon:yes stop_codon:yes gene_type:complete
MIELGGNIKLKGFSEIDNPSLIIVKKIVGNYTKKLTEENRDFKELILELELAKENFKINAELHNESSSKKSNSDEQNLFFAISSALETFCKKR